MVVASWGATGDTLISSHTGYSTLPSLTSLPLAYHPDQRPLHSSPSSPFTLSHSSTEHRRLHKDLCAALWRAGWTADLVQLTCVSTGTTDEGRLSPGKCDSIPPLRTDEGLQALITPHL